MNTAIEIIGWKHYHAFLCSFFNTFLFADFIAYLLSGNTMAKENLNPTDNAAS